MEQWEWMNLQTNHITINYKDQEKMWNWMKCYRKSNSKQIQRTKINHKNYLLDINKFQWESNESVILKGN